MATKHSISGEEFCVLWTMSGSLAEAVDRMSLLLGHPVSRKTVSSRASYYRSRGVLLKTFG